MWNANMNALHRAAAAVKAAQIEYAKAAFDQGDCTKKEAFKEFWERLAIYYEFKITWNRYDKPDNEEIKP